MCLPNILFREFMFALVFSMPLIFILLANSISHFLTASINFSSFNFFQQNSSPLFLITRSCSFSVIHMSRSSQRIFWKKIKDFQVLLFYNSMKHEVKTFKMHSWSGICLLQYLFSLRYGSKGTSNNRKWTIPGTPKSYENTFMMTKENLCVVVLSIIPLHKTSDLPFLNEGSFHSRSFQKYSRTSVETSRTFQEYPTIFQFKDFSRTWRFFKDFSGPVWAMWV